MASEKEQLAIKSICSKSKRADVYFIICGWHRRAVMVGSTRCDYRSIPFCTNNHSGHEYTNNFHFKSREPCVMYGRSQGIRAVAYTSGSIQTCLRRRLGKNLTAQICRNCSYSRENIFTTVKYAQHSTRRSTRHSKTAHTNSNHLKVCQDSY